MTLFAHPSGRRMRPASIVLCLLALAAASPARAQEGGELIQTTDLLKLQQLGQVTLSPDGRTAAYVVRSIEEASEEERKERRRKDRDKEEGPELPAYAYRSQIFLAPLDGSAPPRQLTRGREGASQPDWGPAGDRLAFVRPVDDTPQIFVLPLDGGEAWQLTRMEHGASSPRWSPDGTRIAFSSEVPHHEEAADPEVEPVPPWPWERPGRQPGDTANWAAKEGERPTADPDGDLAAIREWLARGAARDNPRVFDRPEPQGETRLVPRLSYEHVFVVEAREGAEPRDLTPGYFFFGDPRWTPDGLHLVTVGSRDASQHPDRVLEVELFAVAADGSGVRLLLDPPGYSVFSPRLSPDGSQVAFLADPLDDRAYGQLAVGVAPVAGGEPRILTRELDRSARNLVFSGDGRHLYFTAADHGGFPLFWVPTAGGPAERLTGLTGGVRDLDAGPRGLAYVLTEVADPYELYAAAGDGSGTRRLSAHNAGWLAGKTLSFPQARRLTRSDGTRVDFWIMKPTRFEEGRRYPLLLEMHGGPAAMWGPGEATTWHELQLYCARGFAVVYANPRGSGGYGRDFQAANYKDWGSGPAGDVLAAATEAAREPWVDPERQVVTGGSYAGYLTAWIVGHDHRFKAAAAQRGVYDLGTFLGEGNAWLLVPWHHGGYPWEEGAFGHLREQSPLTYVDEIRTPLLILHGDNDHRTGVIQSEVLYKSLKILGKPVEYVRYPGAGHDLSRSGDPYQRLDRLLRIYEFLTRFVEPGGR